MSSKSSFGFTDRLVGASWATWRSSYRTAGYRLVAAVLWAALTTHVPASAPLAHVIDVLTHALGDVVAALVSGLRAALSAAIHAGSNR